MMFEGLDIFELMSRPEEAPFARRVLAEKLDDEGRLAYADVLESREPRWAEWLRLEVALRQKASPDPAVRARFVELSRLVPRGFQKLLGRVQTLNCGLDRGRPAQVRFRLICSERWESLAPTEDPSARHCGRCEERVYQCEDVREAEKHALAGHCIAVPKDLRGGGVDLDTSHYLGMPDPIGDWARRLFPDDG